jgi:hypothetical protein
MRSGRVKNLALNLGGAAALVALLGFGMRCAEQAESHRTAAGRYDEYAKNYKAAAEGKGSMWTSCYGGRWDDYTERVRRDIHSHPRESEYLQQKAAHYEKLRDRHEKAAGRPDPALSPEPPDPE